VALPKKLYGAEVWCTLLSNKKPGQRKKGSVKVIEQLTRTQRAGVLAITGGLYISPTNTLDTLTYLLPFNLIIEKWCYRVAMCLALLLDRHPLQKPVKLSAKCLVKKHRSPLHNLSRLLNTNPEQVSKIAVMTHNPAKSSWPLLKISVPPNKESSKKEVQNVMEGIQVFMDRSVIDGKVGAVVVLTRQGKDH